MASNRPSVDSGRFLGSVWRWVRRTGGRLLHLAADTGKPRTRETGGRPYRAVNLEASRGEVLPGSGMHRMAVRPPLSASVWRRWRGLRRTAHWPTRTSPSHAVGGRFVDAGVLGSRAQWDAAGLREPVQRRWFGQSHGGTTLDSPARPEERRVLGSGSSRLLPRRARPPFPLGAQAPRRDAGTPCVDDRIRVTKGLGTVHRRPQRTAEAAARHERPELSAARAPVQPLLSASSLLRRVVAPVGRGAAPETRRVSSIVAGRPASLRAGADFWAERASDETHWRRIGAAFSTMQPSASTSLEPQPVGVKTRPALDHFGVAIATAPGWSRTGSLGTLETGRYPEGRRAPVLRTALTRAATDSAPIWEHRPRGPSDRPLTPAERFVVSLREDPVQRSRDLPPFARPIARAVLGDDRIPRLATGSASRQALRRAGARAATMGRLIHLPQPLQDSPRDREVLAHELSHVGERSVLPRFLLRHTTGTQDAGERHAVQVSRLASPVGRVPSFPRSPGTTPSTPRINMASPATSVPSSPNVAGPVSRLDVAALPVAGAGGVSRAVARSVEVHAQRMAATPSTAAPTLLSLPGHRGGQLMTAAGATATAPSRPVGQQSVPEDVTAGRATASSTTTGAATSDSTTAVVGPGELGVDRLLDALEDRVLQQLERRGGRYAGAF